MVLQRRAAPSPSGTTTRRNQQSCQKCRKDKQKCLPTSRDWTHKKEKCERCKKLDHPCGPSLKTLKRQSSLSTPSTKLDTNMPKLLADYSRLAVSDLLMAKSVCNSSPEHLQERCTDVTTTSQSVVTYLEPSYPARTYTEIIRSALARLADINTARELLLAARKYTESVQNWFREVSVSVQKLDVLIEELEADFRREIAAAIDSIGLGLDAESDIVVSALLQSHQRFVYPRVLGCNRPNIGESSHLQKILHLSRRTRKGFAGDPVCGSTREIISGDDAQLSTTLAYMDASDAIAHVLEILECGNRSSRSQEQLRFSGDQIAYQYGNNNAAIQLWSLCQERDSSVDVLGRNLLHLVVQNSDHATLGQILSLQGTYTRAIDAIDAFGVTPLEIAACRNDLKCLSMLMSHGAGDATTFSKHGETLIEVAHRNESSKVVDFLWGKGMRLPVIATEPEELLKSENGQHVAAIECYVESSVSSPQEAISTDIVEYDQLGSLPDSVKIDVESESRLAGDDLVKPEVNFSILDCKPLLNFENLNGFDDWPEIPYMDLDNHFCVSENYFTFDLPTRPSNEPD